MNKYEKMWNCMTQRPQKWEIRTVRLDNREGVVFRVESSADSITISNTKRADSSRLNGERTIYREEFLQVASLYEGWRSRTISRPEVQSLTNSQNTSYIFGIVHHFENGGIK